MNLLRDQHIDCDVLVAGGGPAGVPRRLPLRAAERGLYSARTARFSAVMPPAKSVCISSVPTPVAPAVPPSKPKRGKAASSKKSALKPVSAIPSGPRPCLTSYFTKNAALNQISPLC